MRRIITLLTDFGTKDYFVAEMKAVILSINPNVEIVDITHEVEKYNILNASFILACAYKWFPKGTVHVVVVDPGVGTKRRAIVVESKNYYFVGPDNGVLMMASLRDGIKRVVEITNKKYMLERISTTFHGRDIFAPVAAYISKGVDLSDIGREINDYIVPEFVEPQIVDKRTIIGKIIHIDSFGNLITNIDRSILDKLNVSYGHHLEVRLRNKVIRVPFLPSYGYVKKGEFLALIDSEDFLEIAVNQGNASKILNAKINDTIEVQIVE